MTVPTELPPAVFPEALPPSARAWLCVVEAGGKVRRWSVGDVDGWRERFFLGSVAKLVAALVVQALEQQGQVALDRPLLETHSVTLRCLLRHTAGLPDVWPLFACDLAQALSLSLWPPGTAFSYSNLGFVVLGDWLAQHTGQPLSALAARYVFTPYGMAQASLCDALPGAAGGLTATGEDVAQLLTRLLSNRALLRCLVASAIPIPGRTGMAAGLGCFQRICGEKTWLIEHEGFIGDTACVVCLAPEAGWGYALLTKGWPYPLSRTRRRLEAAWFSLNSENHATLCRLPPDAHERYVGKYVNGPRRLRIISRGDMLDLECEGQQFPLLQADDRHLAVAVPLQDKPSTIAVVAGSNDCAIGIYPFGSLRCLKRLFS